MSTLLQSHVVSPHVSVHPYETLELSGHHNILKILSRRVPASAGAETAPTHSHWTVPYVPQ